jgi:UDP-glucose 4-epimerase
LASSGAPASSDDTSRSTSGAELTVFGSTKPGGNRGDFIPIDIEKPSTYRDALASLDVLVLLVSQSAPTRLESTPVTEIEEDLLPHARLLELVEKSDLSHVVVYLSSGGTAYGWQGPEPIDKEHPTFPRSYYGLGKLLIEKTLISGLSRSGRTLTILRPSNPVGPFQELAPIGFVSHAVAAALSGNALEVWGNGSVVRDYFAVSDLYTDIEHSIFDGAARDQLFHVSSGIGRSVNQVIAEVSSILGRRLDLRYSAEVLGWRAKKTFEQIVVELESHDECRGRERGDPRPM